MIDFAFGIQPKTRDELEKVWAERDRVWLEQRERCRCTRPVPDRVYLKHTCCRKCGCWTRSAPR